jgi:predicted flap endonuclease-1-like 5' DNA nuclease
MPTLQDELQTILPAWEEEQALIEQTKQINHNPKATMEQVTKRHLFKPTNNASRETFNAVRDFPNQKPKFYADMLERKGFKHSTVRSLIYQMTRQKQFRQDISGALTTVANAYVPLKSSKSPVVKQLKAKNPAMVKKPSAPVQPAGIGALPVKTDVSVDGHKIGTFKQHAAWKPEDTVDQLTLVQAKAVHAYLQNVFGAL